MDSLTSLFVVAVLLACVLVSIGIWSPRKLWVKGTAFVAAVLFMLVGYAAFSDLLSRPKPVDLEWAQRSVPEATVLAASMQEGESIYLWLEIPGIAGPRAYVIPWSRAAAEELQAALEEAEERGTVVAMAEPFEPSLDRRDPLFHAKPQPAPPPKEPPSLPQIFRDPESEI